MKVLHAINNNGRIPKAPAVLVSYDEATAIAGRLHHQLAQWEEVFTTLKAMGAGFQGGDHVNKPLAVTASWLLLKHRVEALEKIPTVLESESGNPGWGEAKDAVRLLAALREEIDVQRKAMEQLEALLKEEQGKVAVLSQNNIGQAHLITELRMRRPTVPPSAQQYANLCAVTAFKDSDTVFIECQRNLSDDELQRMHDYFKARTEDKPRIVVLGQGMKVVGKPKDDCGWYTFPNHRIDPESAAKAFWEDRFRAVPSLWERFVAWMKR